MSDDDLVMIHCSWDSGPFGTWGESDSPEPKIEAPRGYGTNTVPIPRSVWEAYVAAADALYEAEDALSKAQQAAIDALRANDPRWAAELETPGPKTWAEMMRQHD